MYARKQMSWDWDERRVLKGDGKGGGLADLGKDVSAAN
jgi:hypothetical protein